MFACLAAGYPRGPLPAQRDRLGEAEGEGDYAGVADLFVREILAEQETAGLAMLTDGGVRRSDRLLPLVEGLSGVEPAGTVELPSGERVTRPRIVGEIGRAGPLTVDAWRFAAGAVDLPVKQVLIGPYTIGRLAEGGTGSREAVTLALAESLGEHLRALVAAGCPVIQVDEEAATQIGDDAGEWELFAGAHSAMTAGLPAPGSVHLSLGLTGGSVAPGGFDAVFGLPYVSYLVDLLAGPASWRFVAAVPPERGIVCGAADARRRGQDEVEVLTWAMAWAAAGDRGSDRVGIAPNGSLAGLERLHAKRKIERLGETIRIASMGPLADVAEALDPEPVKSKMADLRTMAEAVEAARRG
jgi:methionine synthase II (cobalamin-independent)